MDELNTKASAKIRAILWLNQGMSGRTSRARTGGVRGRRPIPRGCAGRILPGKSSCHRPGDAEEKGVPRPLTRWKRFRYRLEILAVRLAILILPKLPRSWMLAAARAMALAAYGVDRRGRRVASENLAAIFPEKSASERRRIARESYRHLGVSVFDLFWAPGNLTSENADRYVRYRFDDPEQENWMGRGATIWVTPHYGSFEWLSIQWALTHPSKPLIVAEAFKNPALTTLFTQLREYSGIKIIGQERAMLKLLRHVKRGGQTAFLSDLRVKPSKTAAVIDCFGLQTCVTMLHAFLAKQTGAPILPVICLPKADGTYVFRFLAAYRPAPDASEQEVTQHCWDVFEPLIREAPEPWLWMYKHWRHLPADSRARERYPAYADQSAAFLELARRQRKS